MTPNEAILTALLNFEEEFEVTDKPYKRRGMYIGSVYKCARYQLIAIHTPFKINDVIVPYIKQVQMNSNGDYITSMGNEIENVMRKHLNYRKVPILADQLQVTDLSDFIRGRLDFGIDVPGVGFCIIDAKGMSESVFSRFQNSKLKDFKFDYYMQIVHYIHRIDVPLGFIVGVNRNNGRVAVKEVSKEKSTADYTESIERAKMIKSTTIDDLEKVSPADDNECGACEFVSACRPDFYKTLGV